MPPFVSDVQLCEIDPPTKSPSQKLHSLFATVSSTLDIQSKLTFHWLTHASLSPPHHIRSNPPWLTCGPPPAPPNWSLPASVVQHTSGPFRPRRRPATEAQLQERQQCGRAAAPLDQILHGGAVLQHGPADGHQDDQRQKGESSGRSICLIYFVLNTRIYRDVMEEFWIHCCLLVKFVIWFKMVYWCNLMRSFKMF